MEKMELICKLLSFFHPNDHVARAINALPVTAASAWMFASSLVYLNNPVLPVLFITIETTEREILSY